MQKRIKTLLKDNSLFIAISITLSIAYLSLIEFGPNIINLIEISQIDKLEHAFAYALLTISWLGFVTKKQQSNKKMIVVVLACIFYGIFLEVLQKTITLYRTLEPYDMLANTIGALIGLLIFLRFSKKKQFI